MRYGEDAVDVLRHNMPTKTIIAAPSGATAPAPLPVMLARSFAKTLAALALIDPMSLAIRQSFQTCFSLLIFKLEHCW